MTGKHCTQTLPETTKSTEEENSQPAQFYALRKSLEAVKDAIRIEDYADSHTELQFKGATLRGACPIHGGENPDAFAVYPDRQRWFCFRCNAGGDVLDLCQALEGHAELWTAMLSLARRYGLELWSRPARSAWHEWQAQKDETRTSIMHAITRSYQRRLFRVYGRFLDAIDDAEAHREESERFWEECYPVARVCAMRRVGR